MRRLLVFAIAVVFVESIFFAALAPLLPELTDDLGLSTFGAGVLVAAYAFGALAGAIPSGLAVSRVGVRATVLWGLALLAVTCVAFGFVEGYWALVGARIGQGVAAAFLWTGALAWLVDAAPPDRRGEFLGYTTSGAIAGSLVGPLLGGAASQFGRGATFAGVAVLCVFLAAWALRIPVPEREAPQPLGMLFSALRSRRVLVGMWLIALPSLSLGLVFVLGPLQLDAAGFGALGVTATFLLAAAAEAAVGPGVGIWSDRRGRLAPIRYALLAAAAVLVVVPWVENAWALAGFVVLAGLAVGSFWAPAMAMLTDSWEAIGLAHGLGFALMNFAWAPGNVVGSAVGGGLAELAGDAAAYSIVAALCVATFLALRPRLRKAAPATG